MYGQGAGDLLLNYPGDEINWMLSLIGTKEVGKASAEDA